MKAKRTWQDKLQDDKDLPKIVDIPPKMRAQLGIDAEGREGTIVIARPREVDALMRSVKKGKVTTIDELRGVLAEMHGTDATCPMTTGIFANIAARAADEAEQSGRKRFTPYWRTLKARGELNPKFPGGIELLRSRLEAEGHVVQVRGKRMFVVDYEKRLMRPRMP